MKDSINEEVKLQIWVVAVNCVTIFQFFEIFLGKLCRIYHVDLKLYIYTIYIS